MVRPPRLADFTLEAGHPLRITGCGAGPDATVDLCLSYPVAQGLGVHPEPVGDTGDRALLVAGSGRSSTSIRVARARTSSGTSWVLP